VCTIRANVGETWTAINYSNYIDRFAGRGITHGMISNSRACVPNDTKSFFVPIKKLKKLRIHYATGNH